MGNIFCLIKPISFGDKFVTLAISLTHCLCNDVESTIINVFNFNILAMYIDKIVFPLPGLAFIIPLI